MKYKQKTKYAEWVDRCRSGKEKCAKCDETRHLTVDHIVPVNLLVQFDLDKLEVMYDMEENFEILCLYCNRRKAGMIDVKNPRTYLILFRVIKQAKNYYLPNLFTNENI